MSDQVEIPQPSTTLDSQTASPDGELANAPLMLGGPTRLDLIAQHLATLGQSPAAQGAVPGVLTPGVSQQLQAAAASPQDLLQREAEVAGAAGIPLATAQAQAGLGMQRGAAANQQAYERAIPHTPWIGPNITWGGGILHDIKSALELAAMMTAPGRAAFNAYYGPKAARFQQEQAQRIKEMQATAPAAIEAGARGTGELTQMATRPFSASAALTRAQAETARAAAYGEYVKEYGQRVDAYTREVAADVAVKAAEVAKLPYQEALMKAQAWFANERASVVKEITAQGWGKIDADVLLAQSLANAKQQLEQQKNFAGSTMIDHLYQMVTGHNLGVQPPAPQVQPGAGELPSVQGQFGYGTTQQFGGGAPTTAPERKATARKMKGAAQRGMVQVQIPGHAPGLIPRSKLKAFQEAHPDAVVR